jgi:hypothetical protein
MVEAHADKDLPVPASQAFEEATDLTRADWLPAVRRLRHIGGPARGVGACYQAEVDVPGHRLHGVLVCTELETPRRAVYVLEGGLDLAIVMAVHPAGQAAAWSCRSATRSAAWPVGRWSARRSARRGGRSCTRSRPWPAASEHPMGAKSRTS